MDIIQYLSLFFSILSLLVIVYWVRKDRGIFLYLVTVIAWLLHTVVFYVTRFVYVTLEISTSDILLFSHWSAFLRFHFIFSGFVSLMILSDIQSDINRWVRKIWTITLQKLLKKF